MDELDYSHEALLYSETKMLQAQPDRFFSSSISGVYYGWFDFFINGTLPFQSIKIPDLRQHVKHQHISLSTFCRHLHTLSQMVDRKIDGLLSEKFSIVFAEWTEHAEHYLGIFVSFPADKNDGFSLRMLALQRFENESTLGRDKHIEFIMYLPSFFNKD